MVVSSVSTHSRTHDIDSMEFAEETIRIFLRKSCLTKWEVVKKTRRTNKEYLSYKRMHVGWGETVRNYRVCKTRKNGWLFFSPAKLSYKQVISPFLDWNCWSLTRRSFLHFIILSTKLISWQIFSPSKERKRSRFLCFSSVFKSNWITSSVRFNEWWIRMN